MHYRVGIDVAGGLFNAPDIALPDVNDLLSLWLATVRVMQILHSINYTLLGDCFTR